MARKGATTQDPKPTKAPPPQQATGASKWTRTGPGQYKDQYGNTLRGQQKTPTKDLSKGKVPPTTQPTAATPFEQMDPGQQINQMADIGGGMFQQMAGYSGQFNPYTFQQQYQPQFQESMDRARQSVMNQFEQRNAQAFAKERQDFETAMANRGVAPGGEQYNRELQALTDRQDRARQEAMNAAEQAAQGIQQQGFQQATGISMMPGEIQQQYQAPFMAQYGQYAAGQQAQQQFEYQKQLAALENKFKLQQIRAVPRGGGGDGTAAADQAFANYLMNQYNQGQQTVSPGNAAISGLAQGIGQGIGSYLGRKV